MHMYKQKFSSHTIGVLKSNCLLITLFSIGEIKTWQKMITTTAHKTRHLTVHSRRTARTLTTKIVPTATARTLTTITTIITTTNSVWQSEKRGDKGVSSFACVNAGNACVPIHFLLR